MPLGERIANSIAHCVTHRRWLIFTLLAASVAAGLWIVSSRQNFDTEVLNMLPADEPTVQTLKIVNEQFAQTRELTFAIRGEAEAVANFAEFFVQELRKEPWVVRALAGSPLETSEGFESLQALVPVLLLNLEDKEFQAALRSLDRETLKARLERLQTEFKSGSEKARFELETDPLGLLGKGLKPLVSLENGQHRSALESPDGTLRIIPVVTNQASLSQPDCAAIMAKVNAFKERVRALWAKEQSELTVGQESSTGDDTVPPALATVPEVLVTGRSAYVDQIASSMQRDIQVTSTISILAVTALFYFGFRRLAPLAGIVFILALTCFASFALGSLFFDKLSVIAIAFCSILVGLGDDFSLLLYNRYLRARNEEEPHQQAIATSVREVSRGILFVALTTGAGFMALVASSSRGFAQLGVLIAVGIVLCALCMIALLFLFIPRTATAGTRDRSRQILVPIVTGMQHWRAPLGVAALVCFGIVVAFAVLPVRPLIFVTDPHSLEPRDIPASVALHAISDKLPAAKEALITLVQEPDEVKAHADWEALTAAFQRLKEAGVLESYASPVGFAFSPSRIHAHQAVIAMQPWDDIRGGLGSVLEELHFKRDAFAPAFAMLDRIQHSASAGPELRDLSRILPASSNWWFIIERFVASDPSIKIGYLHPEKPVHDATELRRLENELKKSGAPVRVTGWTYSMLSLAPWAKREGITFSIGVSILILIMLGLAYRNWRPWLTHLLSLIFALALTVTVLKLANFRLNMLNTLAFPLILGVGVDYGMHILLAAHDTDELSTVLKPVVISGLTTIIGFGALIAAKNPALSGLGVVCSVGVGSCLASALLFAVPVLGLFPQRPGPHD